MAPFYGQVERWLGEVRAKIEDPRERDAYRIFSKLAFPPLLPTDRIGPAEVEREVDACLARLRADRLDLLQLHWWDFDDPRYLDVLHYLSELKEKGACEPSELNRTTTLSGGPLTENGWYCERRSLPTTKQATIRSTTRPTDRPNGPPNQTTPHDTTTTTGKIRHVGVTNFDAPALATALESGLEIVSNTVQYSILDQRPAGELTDVCLRHNVTLLCFGSLLGGFLADRWLGEKPPDPRAFTSTSEEKVRALCVGRRSPPPPQTFHTPTANGRLSIPGGH